MSLTYDAIIIEFLHKIREFEFLKLDEDVRTAEVDSYLKMALTAFKKNCLYDLTSAMNDETRSFDIEIEDSDIDELVDIISEGMLIHWMKPYVYRQENLELVINTRDFSTYSPAELLNRISAAYKQAKKIISSLFMNTPIITMIWGYYIYDNPG